MRRFEGHSGVAFGSGLTGFFLLSLIGFVISQASPQWHTWDLIEVTVAIFSAGELCAAAHVSVLRGKRGCRVLRAQ